MIVAAIGLLPVLPDIARAAQIETVPIVATILIVAGALQRVLSEPSVERWLETYFPSTAAVPHDDPQAHQLARSMDSMPGRHRKD